MYVFDFSKKSRERDIDERKLINMIAFFCEGYFWSETGGPVRGRIPSFKAASMSLQLRNLCHAYLQISIHRMVPESDPRLFLLCYQRSPIRFEGGHKPTQRGQLRNIERNL